jgi:membrane protease YdiL (CAAX protease family)
MPTDDHLPIFKACDVARVKNLFAIFVFSLTIPGLIRYCFFNGGVAATAEKVSQISSYVLLVVLSAKYTELSRIDLMEMMNFRIKPRLILALGLGVGLFGFVLGENALEVWVISNFNEELGYSLWPFQQVEHVHIFSPSLYLFLISITIAPLAEEFFFRGLLFSALVKSRSWTGAVLIDSVVFTHYHPMNLHFVSTMVFSIVLCWLYRTFESLWMCIVVHGVFNLVAISVENYGASWLTRSLDQVSLLSSWSEQFIFMGMCMFVIALILRKINYKKDKEE